ncbi:helix-turn-helix transcriptional regulator [Serratia sp. N21D137]|uniref:helix-turn-helix transcriptional regulator n=1 Tax=Serratia sp. N21D137 TaxID=3397495 RepID=UPI0039E1FA07
MKINVITDNSYFFLGIHHQLDDEDNNILKVSSKDINTIHRTTQKEKEVFLFFLDNYNANTLLLAATGFFNGKMVFIPTNKNHSNNFNKVSLTVRDIVDNILMEIHSKDDENQPNSVMEKLTKREVTILQYVLQGKSPNFMSKHLGISIKTVYGHRKRAFHKLGGRNIFELWPIKEKILNSTGAHLRSRNLWS